MKDFFNSDIFTASAIALALIIAFVISIRNLINYFKQINKANKEGRLKVWRRGRGIEYHDKEGNIVITDYQFWIPRWSDLKRDFGIISNYVKKTWNREWGWLKIKEIIFGILYLPFFLWNWAFKILIYVILLEIGYRVWTGNSIFLD